MIYRCLEVTLKIGVKRFILMSVNGVRLDGTTYQRTKWQADEVLKKSGLNWTIFDLRSYLVTLMERGDQSFAPRSGMIC